MVLMGHGRAKQGHDTITGKLVDGPLVPVDLMHQDLETPVHDLVDFLRVEPFGNGGEVGHIRKEYGHQFPFSFDRAPGGEDLICEVFGGVGLGVVEIYGRGF